VNIPTLRDSGSRLVSRPLRLGIRSAEKPQFGDALGSRLRSKTVQFKQARRELPQTLQCGRGYAIALVSLRAKVNVAVEPGSHVDVLVGDHGAEAQNTILLQDIELASFVPWP
jgi:hypothetical protein